MTMVVQLHHSTSLSINRILFYNESIYLCFDKRRPSPVNATASTKMVTCGGKGDGAVNICASGGVPPYMCSLDSGNYSSCNIVNVTAGSHAVSVRDSFGCVFNIPTEITLTENSPLSISSQVTRTVGCFGEVCKYSL